MNSELTNALNKILVWLQQNKPDYVERLYPGLSRTEVDILIHNLPFIISQEIYELYQWRNGARGEWMDITALFSGWSFYPLDKVVLNYQKADREKKKFLIHSKSSNN